MLVIRKEQMEAFSQVTRNGFVNRLTANVKSRYPELCAQLGDSGVREWVEKGMQRAGRYDIRSEQDVALYVWIMFELRPDFDTHPETAWAREILTDSSKSAYARLQRVRAVARNPAKTGLSQTEGAQ